MKAPPTKETYPTIEGRGMTKTVSFAPAEAQSADEGPPPAPTSTPPHPPMLAQEPPPPPPPQSATTSQWLTTDPYLDTPAAGSGDTPPVEGGMVPSEPHSEEELDPSDQLVRETLSEARGKGAHLMT